MANEAERLRAQVAIAEKRAQGFDPYGNPYTNSNPMYTAPPMHLATHVDSYQTSHIPVALGAMGDGTYLYGSSVAVSAQDGMGAPPLPGTGGNEAWRGSHDAPQARG